MGYRLNRLDEPVFMAVSKLLLTEFGIHHRLESCALFSAKPWHRQFCSEASLYYLWRLWSQPRLAKPSCSVSTFTDQTAVVVSLTSRSGHSLIFSIFSFYFLHEVNDLSWERLFFSVPPSNSLKSVSDPWWAFLSWHGALHGPSTHPYLIFRK